MTSKNKMRGSVFYQLRNIINIIYKNAWSFSTNPLIGSTSREIRKWFYFLFTYLYIYIYVYIYLPRLTWAGCDTRSVFRRVSSSLCHAVSTDFPDSPSSFSLLSIAFSRFFRLHSVFVQSCCLVWFLFLMTSQPL